MEQSREHAPVSGVRTGNLPWTDCEREQTCELQENKATICKDTETYSGRVASFKCLMPIVYTAVVSVIP